MPFLTIQQCVRIVTTANYSLSIADWKRADTYSALTFLIWNFSLVLFENLPSIVLLEKKGRDLPRGRGSYYSIHQGHLGINLYNVLAIAR